MQEACPAPKARNEAPAPAVAQAKALITQVLAGAETTATGNPPGVRVVSLGIPCRVKYWLSQQDCEMACGNDLFSRIDAALRENGISLKPWGNVLA